MNNKNSADEIKLAIKRKIYEKSVLAYKYAFNSDFNSYAKALETFNLRPFCINNKTLRSVDRKCVIDGKRTWMYKIAIQELVDDGSLIVSNSYCKAPQNNYSKAYALTVEALKAVLKTVNVIDPVIVPIEEFAWDESMDFMAGYERDEPRPESGRFLSECYPERQIQKWRTDCEAAGEYCRKCSKREYSNKYTYEGKYEYCDGEAKKPSRFLSDCYTSAQQLKWSKACRAALREFDKDGEAAK